MKGKKDGYMLLQKDPHCSKPSLEVFNSKENTFLLFRDFSHSVKPLRGSSKLKCLNYHENHNQIFE